MKFVTVGSQKLPFDPLNGKVYQMVRAGILEDEVFIQTGTSQYSPACPHQAFCGQEAFAERIKTCDILITHGGAGTMVDAVKLGKKVIAVPRLARYGEHVDDHQMELAARLHARNLLYACMDTELLPKALRSIRGHSFAPFHSNTETFLASLDSYIRSL